MYKGAYHNCRFCHGNGCISCDVQRKKDEARAMEPIFTADRNNPEDMKALNRIAGADALSRALGPEGGGMNEILENAVLESLKQVLRKGFSSNPPIHSDRERRRVIETL